MQHLSEVEPAARQLHALCVASDIPPFACVAYDAETDIASFIWDESDFGLFVLLEDYDLGSWTPERLRELWDEEEHASVDIDALAVEAMLN